MRPSMGPSLRGAADAGAIGGGNSIRGSAEADLERICDRLEELTSLADVCPADVCSSGRVEVPSEIERSDGSGVSLPLPTLGRKGFAEAIITFDGAGAGDLSRSVASNMPSSLPSSGARPTYSTRTRASPWP